MLKPTGRLKVSTRVRGAELGRRLPTPLRDCQTSEDLDREERREDLRDRRWRRWRNMIVTLTCSAGVLSGAVPIEQATAALRAAIGIP